jgi:fructokinase
VRIGVDLGGTKTEVLALDAGGRELLRQRIPTPRDYEATVGAVAELIRSVEEELGRSGTVGVGMPGTLSPTTGLVKNANSTWLIGRPFDHDLAETLGREVRCANDANCLAVSESIDGAAVGADVVFAVILGTGVGGGIAVRGEPLSGANGVAGEWGHNPLPWAREDESPGPACYCGRNGCIETWLSGPGLAADHARVTARRADAEQVVHAADAGDEDATATLDRYVDRLARGLAHVIDILDPDVIVLGGGVSNVDRLYEEVPPRLGEWVFGGDAITPLRRSAHGDSSGVRGAALLW